MKRYVLPVLVLLSWSAGSLAAQETARERARASLPPDLFHGVEVLVADAAALGIPEDPLFNKALEGLAKRVPQDRILPAVTAYASRLQTAWGAFGAQATGPLAVAGADALQRGVAVETLRSLGERVGSAGGQARQGAPGQSEETGPSPVAVLVLADLVEAGVPADRALGVLQEAIRMRAREQQMLGITGRVRQLMRQGQSPQEAAEQVRRALQRGRGGGGIGPPLPPGSEPVTARRQRTGGRNS
jgi:hypothetical protein